MGEATKAALVTGASGGIGGAIAAMLAREGYALTLVGRDASALEQVVAVLGVRARAAAADLTDANAVVAAVAAHEAAFGRLDLLVNAAGALTVGPIEELTTVQVDAMFDVNLRAPVLFYRAAALLLKRTAAVAGSALVVNIASISGKRADARFGVYAASKFGLRGLAQAMAAELGPLGVATSTLFPGVVDTAMADWARDWLPAGRMLQPSDVADAVHRIIGLPARDVPAEIDFDT